MIMETEIFKVSPSIYMRTLMAMWIKRNWWAIALPVAACIALALTVDVKFVYVALMMVFVVIPPIMMIVYFYHALSPESRMSILLHKLTLDDNGITVTYEPIDEDTPAPRPATLAWSEIKCVTYSRNAMVYRLTSGRYSILYLPYASFASKEGLRQWSAAASRHLAVTS